MLGSWQVHIIYHTPNYTPESRPVQSCGTAVAVKHPWPSSHISLVQSCIIPIAPEPSQDLYILTLHDGWPKKRISAEVIISSLRQEDNMFHSFGKYFMYNQGASDEVEEER